MLKPNISNKFRIFFGEIKCYEVAYIFALGMFIPLITSNLVHWTLPVQTNSVSYVSNSFSEVFQVCFVPSITNKC